jgi:hypothetical protein
MLRPWLAGVVNVLFSYSGDRAIAVLVLTALLVFQAGTFRHLGTLAR